MLGDVYKRQALPLHPTGGLPSPRSPGPPPFAHSKYATENERKVARHCLIADRSADRFKGKTSRSVAVDAWSLAERRVTSIISFKNRFVSHGCLSSVPKVISKILFIVFWS